MGWGIDKFQQAVYNSGGVKPLEAIYTVAVLLLSGRRLFLLPSSVGRGGAYDLHCAPLFVVVTYEMLFAFTMVLIALAALFANRK